MAAEKASCSKKVVLCEEDIPRAKLPRENVEECTVPQLRRWLLCGGAKTSGKKADLVKRYKDYVKGGLHLKNLRDPDGGVHLARKKVLLGVMDEVDPPHVTDIFPKDGFHEDLTDLPFVNFGTVWKYMIESSNAKKQLSTAKPLVKGFNFFKSGNLVKVTVCSRENKWYLKSQVLPSMKKSSVYNCFILLLPNGHIKSAYCGCPAGVDGRCNHIAAALFGLEEFCKQREKQQQEQTSRTSQPCTWNVPRKRKGEVLPISQMKFKKHEHGKEKKAKERSRI
ncbi:unnamed protein product [Porites evermanni]|uniref:SAP domain-containing protein n=2 Tax=Porites evermanni TaxID=104178 RepID=A0ABN8S3P6_9CNID|nr:unnamed protein product [Porites evermanni]